MDENKQMTQTSADAVTPLKFWGTLALAGILLLISVYFIVVLSRENPTPAIYIGIAAFLITLISTLISATFAFRRQSELGLKILFYMLLALAITVVSIFQGRAVPLMFAVLMIASILIRWLLPRQAWLWYAAVAAAALILMWITEWINPPWRVQVAAATIGPAAAIIFGIIITVAAVYQIYGGILPFIQSSIRNRLTAIVVGLALVSVLLVAASGLFGLNRVQGAYENTLAGGVEIQNRSDHLNSELLEARRSEKDFLLRWQTEGFDVAYESYVKVNQGHTADMKVTLQELEVLAPVLDRNPLADYSRTQYEADIASLNENVVAYEKSFASAVSLIQERGFVDTGLEGEFLTAVRAIEAKILDREGFDKLVITMLQIRRHEKNYLLRGEQTYIDQTIASVAELKDQITTSELLTPAEKTEIKALADEYLVKFNGLVAKDVEVAAEIEVFRAAAADTQSATGRIEVAGETLAVQDIATAQTNSTQTLAITGVIVLIVLIVSIVLAITLSQQLTRPIISLTNTAQTISAGNFNIQADVESTDEIGTLAQSFNIMTSRLGQAFEDVRRRATELATVAEVGTATATILQTDRLLQEVVDLTKERFNLYHSHIYLLDEAGENLLLTAGAGEPGRIMVSEKRSIPLSRAQSLVARAAREQKGVIVNDVTAATDFLANPLLPDTRSELAVPMIVGGKVIGVFDVQSDQVGRFTESDVNIQTTLAAQVSTSIQNVRSFEQSKAQSDLESLVNAIGQKIQNATTVEDTLQTAIRELGLALGATRVSANIQATRQDNGDEARRN